MPKERILSAIDIGSSKICCIVVSLSDEKVSVIGNATIPSSGIDRGVVNDIDKAVEAISQAIEKAEKMAGHAISSAIVTINGQHIQSENSTGVVAVSEASGEITWQDIMRVNEAAQAITIPANREVIHVIPRDYVVDSQKNIKNPEGMSGIRLEVEAHIIHASTTILKNLTKCVKQVGVDVSDLVYTALASSHAVLTDTERELGTVLIDMGGRTMSCIVYQNGAPVYSFVVPVGGKHITGDIAVGLRCSLDTAEKIKLRFSKNEEQQDLPDVLGAEEALKKGELYVGDIDPDLNTVPKRFLEKIINQRLEEMFSLVNLELSKAGYAVSKNSEGNLHTGLPAGAILTGGASQTKQATEVAKKVLHIPVRLAQPRGLTGLIDEIDGPAYSAAVGSILFKSENMEEDSFKGTSLGNIKVKGLLDKLKGLLKALIP